MFLKSSIGNKDFPSLDDVCSLISITVTKDELGQFIKAEKSYLVFCSKLSITRAEFSSAGTVGHKPEILLVVDTDSYNDEKYLDYHNKKYNVYKSFQRVDGFTELFCEMKQGEVT
jgi:hypothetical protein